MKGIRIEPDSTQEPHHHWSGFPTLEDYLGSIPAFYLRSEIPQAIKTKLEVVYRLMIFGYYEIGFFDVALARTLQIVEMGLKSRYAELKKVKPPKSMSLSYLINELGSLGIFDRKIEFVRILKDLRNSVIHSDPSTTLASMANRTIYEVVGFINEFYEDLNHKEQRREMERDLADTFTVILQNGACLTAGERSFAVFETHLIHCSFNVGAPEFHIAFVPTYALPDDPQSAFEVPEPIIGVFSSYSKKGKAIQFFDNRGKFIQLEAFETPSEAFVNFTRKIKGEEFWPAKFSLRNDIFQLQHCFKKKHLGIRFSQSQFALKLHFSKIESDGRVVNVLFE